MRAGVGGGGCSGRVRSFKINKHKANRLFGMNPSGGNAIFENTYQTGFLSILYSIG